MGHSGDNRMTSLQASEPALCTNGCGFFGTAATDNLCSKCFRDLRLKEESAADAKFAFQKSAAATEKPAAVDTTVHKVATEPTIGGGVVEEKKRTSNRCGCCNKKVGVTGFACRCGVTFCGTHRYPEEHKCSFDYKARGKEAIAKANPLVKADKIQRF